MVVARPSKVNEGDKLLKVDGMKTHREGSAEISTNPDAKMEEPDTKEVAPRPRRSKGRRIKFYPGVAVRECLHINNYTDDEIYHTWYRRNDFQRIKMSFQYIVQRVTNKTWAGDTLTETARGLEYRNREGAMKRKANKLNALMAVLDEQERQWRRGVDDDEAISAAIMTVSVKSARVSCLIAAKDEAEVAELWKDDDVVTQVTHKLSEVSVNGAIKNTTSSSSSSSSSKRKDAPEADHHHKKTRLKAFMKKIQTAQRVGHKSTTSTQKSVPQAAPS